MFMSKTKPLVYSYIRFSAPSQSEGASVDRQLEHAKNWATEHGMELDTSLTMRDEGLSAYHQKHVQRGAFGVFLRAIEEGKIAPGSTLVVEGLDRMSRAHPLDAQSQLTSIINAGVTVVTAMDRHEYNREIISKHPEKLFYILAMMMRAHEESETKSKRVKDAIKRAASKRQHVELPGRIGVGREPAWLKWNGTGWDLIPERVEAIKVALDLYRKGYGSLRLTQEMRARGLSYTAKAFTDSHLYRLVRQPALAGIRTVQVDGEAFEVPAYFPALISVDEFKELQATVARRKPQTQKTEIPSLLTGLKITYCGYCGASIAHQTRPPRPGAKAPPEGRRRLRCLGAAKERRCINNETIKAGPVERALLSYASDELNLTALFDGTDRAAPVRAQLAAARVHIGDVQAKIDNIVDAIAGGMSARLFTHKLEALEVELAKAQADARNAESELVAASAHVSPDLAKAWASLVEGVLDFDFDARVQARDLLSKTFERITIYRHGLRPEVNDAIDIVLVGRGGNSQHIRVDRDTGEWKAGDVDELH